MGLGGEALRPVSLRINELKPPPDRWGSGRFTMAGWADLGALLIVTGLAGTRWLAVMSSACSASCTCRRGRLGISDGSNMWGGGRGTYEGFDKFAFLPNADRSFSLADAVARFSSPFALPRKLDTLLLNPNPSRFLASLAACTSNSPPPSSERTLDDARCCWPKWETDESAVDVSEG